MSEAQFEADYLAAFGQSEAALRRGQFDRTYLLVATQEACIVHKQQAKRHAAELVAMSESKARDSDEIAGLQLDLMAEKKRHAAEVAELVAAVAALRKEDCGAWLGNAAMDKRYALMKKIDAVYKAASKFDAPKGQS